MALGTNYRRNWSAEDRAIAARLAAAEQIAAILHANGYKDLNEAREIAARLLLKRPVTPRIKPVEE